MFISTHIIFILAFLVCINLACPEIEDEPYYDLDSITPSQSKVMCETAECIHTAATILRPMDTSVNPCDNFYKFACGKFKKELTEFVDKENTTPHWIDEIEYQVKKRLVRTLIYEIKESDPSVFKKIKSYYNMCTNMTELDEKSRDNLLEIFKELGGWPAAEGETWTGSNFDLEKTMHKIYNMGFAGKYFFNFTVTKNGDKKMIVSISKIPFYLNSTDHTLFSESKHDWALFLGAKYFDEVQEALNFEAALSKINNFQITKFTSLKNLQITYPYLNWTALLSDHLNYNISDQDSNNFKVLLQYDLGAFFKVMTETPKRVLANYLFLKVADEASKFMSNQVRDLVQNHMPNQAQFRKQRWQRCMDFIEEKLPLALGVLYAEKNFDEDSKNQAISMAINLKKSLRDLVTKIKWINENTKRLALEKLDDLAQLVAYPKGFFNKKKLDEYYENLELFSENNLKSSLSLIIFSRTHTSIQFDNTIYKNNWISYKKPLSALRTHYEQFTNSIEIPVALLYGFFFSKDRPHYLNYATSGHIIGRELALAFDSVIKRTNKDGNFPSIMDEEFSKNYEKRAQCFINQYNNYTDDRTGLKIDGRQTLVENIADSGGIKLAYHAYNSWAKENGIEPHLPGLKYTSQQMFWISAANVWCDEIETKAFEIIIKSDSHSPPEFRVNGPLSNMREFSRDFNCPTKSNMNPSRKFGIL